MNNKLYCPNCINYELQKVKKEQNNYICINCGRNYWNELMEIRD